VETSEWETHCFGRFLIDLPNDAEISQAFDLEGASIKKLQDMKVGDVSSALDTRENVLKATPHRTRGVMFVDRVTFQHGSAGIIRWPEPYSVALQYLETFLVAQGSDAVYQYVPQIDPAQRNAAYRYVDSLSRDMYSLNAGQIPPVGAQAFCIEGAYLKGNEFRSESMNITVRLPDHPGMVFSLSSTTAGDVDETLMQRMSHFGSGIIRRTAGIQTLRKGDRAASGIKGQEYLVAGTEDGERRYVFIFENFYKAMSVANPQVNVDMYVEGRPDQAPAITSDAEALKLWDALIDSVRPISGSSDAAREPSSPSG